MKTPKKAVTIMTALMMGCLIGVASAKLPAPPPADPAVAEAAKKKAAEAAKKDADLLAKAQDQGGGPVQEAEGQYRGSTEKITSDWQTLLNEPGDPGLFSWKRIKKISIKTIGYDIFPTLASRSCQVFSPVISRQR
jgi:hypothetical protein